MDIELEDVHLHLKATSGIKKKKVVIKCAQIVIVRVGVVVSHSPFATREKKMTCSRIWGEQPFI